MNAKKQARRKPGATKLEPIDWREFANDAVLNGNMSTLYRRPPTEDPSAYASDEALVEIEKRVVRPADPEPSVPTVGPDEPTPTGVKAPTVGLNEATPVVAIPTASPIPTVDKIPTVGPNQTVGTKDPGDVLPPPGPSRPTGGSIPTVGKRPTAAPRPTVDSKPTVGSVAKKKIKPIRDVNDALTLAGQVLYRAMSGSPADAWSTSCTKGYRQLAAETRLDKDTVRDLIVEFKEKGLVRETATYDPDTRLSKTYEVLSPQAALQLWQEAGIRFVTTGRQRPLFCSAEGDPMVFTPTVGISPSAS